MQIRLDEPGQAFLPQILSVFMNVDCASLCYSPEEEFTEHTRTTGAGPFALLTKVELKHDETTDIESSQVPPDIQNKPCYLIMK